MICIFSGFVFVTTKIHAKKLVLWKTSEYLLSMEHEKTSKLSSILGLNAEVQLVEKVIRKSYECISDDWWAGEELQV